MSTNNLLSPIKIGSHVLNNRLVFTFSNSFFNSQQSSISSPDLKERYALYYKAGLIVSEPTTIISLDDNHRFAGIYTSKQIRNWRKATEYIHEQGGKIFLQLWHCGLEKKPCLLDEETHNCFNVAAYEKCPSPLYLSYKSETLETISAEIFRQFRSSTQNALAAEFDGVEIHFCPGRLIDCFVDNKVDQNFGDYARDLEARVQLLLGVIEAAANVIDEERVGVKIAPSHKLLGFKDPDPEGTFFYLLDALNFYNLAYVHLFKPKPENSIFHGTSDYINSLRSVYRKNLMLNTNDRIEQAAALISGGKADLVACYNDNVNYHYPLSKS